MIFFTADTHFADEATLMATGRPFKNTSEMDMTLVNNWNKTVRPDDVVFILGDFGALNYTKFLNGKKILIKGNREDPIPESELQKYFDFVYTDRVVHLYEQGYHIVMTHKPISLPKINVELSPDEIQVFGHIHRTALYRPYGLNVGTDVNYYTPVSLDVVIQRCDFIKTYYDQGIFI